MLPSKCSALNLLPNPLPGSHASFRLGKVIIWAEVMTIVTNAVVAADALPSITYIYMQHVAMLLNILLDTTFVPSTEEERTHVTGMPSRTRMCHRRWLQRMRYLNRNIRFCQKNVRTHHLNHSEFLHLSLI